MFIFEATWATTAKHLKQNNRNVRIRWKLDTDGTKKKKCLDQVRTSYGVGKIRLVIGDLFSLPLRHDIQ